MSIPRYVAFCGYPESGKSTAAELLVEGYGGRIIDDGNCLREGAMALYGLTRAQVTTQEGKKETVTVCGKEFTVRQLLGDLGKLMESKHGSQFMPERAIASTVGLDDVPFFAFPSVRMDQGLTYLKNGGIVIEVVRDGTKPVYDFDHYDLSLVNFRLVNNGSKNDLRHQLDDIMSIIKGVY